jgi:hypothetical protein
VSETMQLQLKRVHFGVAPTGSALAFKVEAASGAAVKAALNCDSNEICTWEWADLQDGQQIERVLADTGTYTLTFMVPFTASAGGTVDLTVCINDKTKTITLAGQQPDIGKGLAVVIVK